jgi:hypothetical protein
MGSPRAQATTCQAINAPIFMNPVVRTCDLIAFLSASTIQNAPDVPICPPLQQQLPSVGAAAAAQPLPALSADLRPLPPGAFPNASALWISEGPAYYWVNRVLRNFNIWTACSATQSLLLPPGWRLMATFKDAAGADAAGLLVNNVQGTLLVLVKGTSSKTDWSVRGMVRARACGAMKQHLHIQWVRACAAKHTHVVLQDCCHSDCSLAGGDACTLPSCLKPTQFVHSANSASPPTFPALCFQGPQLPVHHGHHTTRG